MGLVGEREGGLGLVSMGREGRVGMGLLGPEEDEPKTLPWPLNLPEGDEEKGLLTFFMKPLTLSFMSSMEMNKAEQKICGLMTMGLVVL